MVKTALTRESRQNALHAMADEELDVLVIGGGVTGAGVALDATTRGLKTGIIDMRDWASGTSQWSSKLVHGGLRYLYQLDFPLVAEALRERGTLLTTTAPHLVSAQPFLWPLKQRVIERAYSAVGVGMYDALAMIGGKSVPIQKHYGHKGVMELVPSLDPTTLIGGIRFFDARVDDARLVIDLVRTAQGYGALAASRAQATEFITEGNAVVGAVVTDLETGDRITVRAKHIIGATGVWTEETESLGGSDGGLKVLASKGIHIVVPKDRIEGQTGVFLRTEKSVLFIIPWERYWVIGTTDTTWHEQRDAPVATSRDIDYVLEQANSVLADKLTRDDIIGTYAGLRPLLQPGTKGSGESTKVSREHTVTSPQPGLTVIAGGKLTTYRQMAEDAVDHVLGAKAASNPSVTATTPLVGAHGFEAAKRRLPAFSQQYRLTQAQVKHLFSRYGSELPDVLSLIDSDETLAQPLEHAPDYLAAEVVFAVTHEGALHLEDVLLHRIRLDFEQPDRGQAAAPQIAAIMGGLLAWDDATRENEVANWTAQAQAILDAQQLTDDADASKRRIEAGDIVPLAGRG
ncbi:glycerol-3-phosphate dehydrogenase/oxidase [Flaviflexus equikiangi]|uniref:Glycerol-3-phosphate dehydrogenase n=1 Tax=Flaviflexus equikiangi TaxID=2758573 RepID=A0ABS2TEN5_9ACTO|nr:glycerol-3-phosphate dehydrogenase/oxidase [Flaviflexus equikiangi]MBM9433092.1 glycerol-3-phosphate dehydrogenase/oxidase [Flaviflexus equikiangi]